MLYYKSKTEVEGIKGYTFIELSKENYVYRQLSKINNEYISSNRNHENPKYWHWLSEGKYILNEEDILIEKCEFEKLWDENNKKYFDLWIETKRIYPINTIIKGSFEVNYPQGILFQIDKKVIAIMDYSNNKLDEFIEGNVIGYDECNMWLKIK